MSEANDAIVRRIYEQGFEGGAPSIDDALDAADFRHRDRTIHDV